MTPVIEQLKQHRTYRHFDAAYTLPDEQLQAILDAARQAPTWMNGQHYSIIVVDDPTKKKALAELIPSNSSHLTTASVFLLFVADMRRMNRVSEHYGSPFIPEGTPEPLIICTTDAALAAENAVVAAESLELGSVVVGSVRKVADSIISLFKMPEYTYPLFGMSIGKPDVEMKVKPRLPEQAVIHRNEWTEFDYSLIEDYDVTMKKFGEARETKLWSVKFRDYYAEEANTLTRQLLKKQKI